jgi:adenine phosphoribosyltransferase
MDTTLPDFLKAAIRTIPDYPKPGIMFRDITTLLGNARAFRRAIDELVQPWAGSKIDKIAGIEARGFILGGAVAHQLSAGFVPIRKKGKLPHQTVRMAYALEYGTDEMEMHVDAVAPGERVILVDDLIATGGTAEGAVKLLRSFHCRPARSGRRQTPASNGRASAYVDWISRSLNGAKGPAAWFPQGGNRSAAARREIAILTKVPGLRCNIVAAGLRSHAIHAPYG